MRRLLGLLVVLCLLPGLAGCGASSPHSSEQIERWLESEFRGDFDFVSSEDKTVDRGLPATSFRFTDQDGLEFWALSRVQQSYLWDTTYVRNSTNYLSVWYDARRADILAALGDYAITLSSDESTDSTDFAVRLAVPCEYKYLPPLSQDIALALNEVGNPMAKATSALGANISVNCTSGDGERPHFLASYSFPHPDKPVRATEVLKKLEPPFVTAQWRGEIDGQIPAEVFERFHPPSVDLVVAGETIVRFTLRERSGEYYTAKVSPIGSVESGTSRSPVFAQLVALLGGTYTTTAFVHDTSTTAKSDDGQASAAWTIGEHTWEAFYVKATRSPTSNSTRRLTVTMDGEQVLLTNSTPSPKELVFTTADLEKLLGVTITLDYATATATIP